jgi:tRNA pseudouridine(55) synthase
MDGVLIVDKPSGITSHDVIDHLRRASGIKDVGHAGTLDPLAEGVLLCLLGRATRLTPYLQELRGQGSAPRAAPRAYLPTANPQP